VSNWDAEYQRWLEDSYQYYILSVETSRCDYDYDLAASHLLKNWDEVTHPAKSLITEDDLRCGSAFTIKKEDYPEDIQNKFV
jgi:hypothetical protein